MAGVFDGMTDGLSVGAGDVEQARISAATSESQA
jgi:hypothetical protein